MACPATLAPRYVSEGPLKEFVRHVTSLKNSFHKKICQLDTKVDLDIRSTTNVPNQPRAYDMSGNYCRKLTKRYIAVCRASLERITLVGIVWKLCEEKVPGNVL